jgi:uncharacterized protein
MFASVSGQNHVSGELEMKLKDKYGPWALITGASEGTGAAFAHRLAAEGINCILVSRREAPLQALAAEVKKKGVEVITAAVDLSALDATDRIVAAVGNREVGLLITNAGADTNGTKFLNSEAANWDQLINLNVVTTMRNCHHAAASFWWDRVPVMADCMASRCIRV